MGFTILSHIACFDAANNTKQKKERKKERKNERKMLGKATAGKMSPVDKLPAVRKESTHCHSDMLVNCENTPT